jgi:hypothetical protein
MSHSNPLSDPTIDPLRDDPSTFHSILDRRPPPHIPIPETHKTLGDGLTHHDILNFSLTSADEPTPEVLILKHHVRASYFRDMPTPTLMRLLADVLDLQDERRFALDVAVFELPAREHTIWTMEEVLEARGEWDVDGDGGDDGGRKEGGEKNDDEGNGKS